MIRILVVPVGKAPVVHEVETGFKHWYGLIHSTTSLLQPLNLPNNLQILFDEEGGPGIKKMPLNTMLSAGAPKLLLEPSFIVDMTNGKGLLPGDLGTGFHKIYGAFIITRVKGSSYVSLTDKDIVRCKEALGRG